MRRYRLLFLPAGLIVGFVLLCLGPYFVLLPLQEAWLEFVAPRGDRIALATPVLLTRQLPGSSYALEWSRDGDTISVLSSNWSSATPDLPPTITRVDVRTGETILEEPLDADGPSNALPMGAGDADVWVECSDGDVVVRGRGFDGGWGEYELAVIREGETVGGFRFAPRQSEDVFRIVFADFRFSPECGYLAVILSGDIGPDQQARDELWILDLAAQTLEWALMSRWSPFLIFDYPVQTVDPAWSPDGSRVVFGDGEFGLETYDVMRGRRRLLAGPQRDLYDPVWSPTGKWIAAVSLGREGGYVAVITPDGRHAAYSPQCDGAYAFAWSPLRDELAYICSGRSCEADSLWMWRVGETE